MSWVRIDSAFPGHRKVLDLEPDLSNAAVGLHLLAICYADAYRTDGHLPRRAMRLVTADPGWQNHAAELVRVGLWHEAKDGYDVHDYLQWQRSAAEIEALSKMQRGKALKRWANETPADGDTDCDADGIPDGIPDGYAAEQAVADSREEQQPQSDDVSKIMQRLHSWHGTEIDAEAVAALVAQRGAPLVAEATARLVGRKKATVDKPLAVLGMIVGDLVQAGWRPPEAPGVRLVTCAVCGGSGRQFDPVTGEDTDTVCPTCLGERWVEDA